MTPQEKNLLIAKTNSYFYKNHGVKIQSAFSEYMKKRRALLEGTSVFDKSIDYSQVTREIAKLSAEFETVENAEILDFDELKKAIIDLQSSVTE